MKQFLALVMVLLILVLAGCSAEEPMTVTDRYGDRYTIDPENGTITDGTYTYLYTYEGDSEVFQIRIEYPNGATYHYSESHGFGTGSHSALYSEEFYRPGDRLADVLAENIGSKVSARNALAIAILVGLGIFAVISPQTLWYLKYGWHFRDAEPSDAAIAFTRISGGVCIVIAVIMLLC